MRRARLALCGVGALVGAVLLAPAPVEAGFLDFFSERSGSGSYYQPEARPLNVVVRRQKTSRAARKRELARLAPKKMKPKKVAASLPAKKKVAAWRRPQDPPARRVVHVDVEANPTWYLQDATLRRGDILVLKTGAVVFEGQTKTSHAREDFASLRQTRLVSKSGQRDIRMAASGIWTAPEEVAPVRQARRRTPLRREASALPQ